MKSQTTSSPHPFVYPAFSSVIPVAQLARIRNGQRIVLHTVHAQNMFLRPKKNTFTCPNCGSKVSKTSFVCKNCGRDVS